MTCNLELDIPKSKFEVNLIVIFNNYDSDFSNPLLILKNWGQI